MGSFRYQNGWDAAGLGLDLGIDFISPGIGANLGTGITEQTGWIASANFSESFVKVGADLSSGLTFSGTAEVTASRVGSRVTQVAELGAANAAKGLKIEGQLKEIFGNRKLFSNWLKGNQSLTRVEAR